MSSVQEITSARDLLVAGIRAYCKSQVGLWQQVPLLALMADGRDGGMGFYERAYRDGLWAIDGCAHLTAVFVDCDSGDLVRVQQIQMNRYYLSPAWDDRVLGLANKMGSLDAEHVIAALKKKIDNPLPSWISQADALERERDREERRKRYSVTPIYTRRKAAA